MSEMLLSEFLARTDSRGRRLRQPTSATFEVTPTCNLRCQFCYVALDPYKGPYLSTAQCREVIDRIADSGVLSLSLTGGEIFSRRDFAEIYLHARSRGLLVTLLSNATMVTDAIAALLREHPPFGVEVSIYGADAEHYERVTQIKGSFARFERGVALLQQAGVRLLLKHPISALTEHHLPAIRRWCAERGIRHKFDPVIENRHSGGQEPSLYRIQPRRVVEIEDALHLELTGERRGLPLAECATDDGNTEALYRCGAGKESFFVDGLGNASHCIIDREPTFPILGMPWEELWARMGEWVTQDLPADAPCSGCSLRGGCDNCPARARLASGSPYGKDVYQCDITHAAHGLPPARAPELPMARPLAACAR